MNESLLFGDQPTKVYNKVVSRVFLPISATHKPLYPVVVILDVWWSLSIDYSSKSLVKKTTGFWPGKENSKTLRKHTDRHIKDAFQ